LDLHLGQILLNFCPTELASKLVHVVA